MSFTPGTWTTEELGEENVFIPRKWPAFSSLCQKIMRWLSFLLSPSLYTAQGSLQASILSLLLPQGLSAFAFPHHHPSLHTPRSL